APVGIRADALSDLVGVVVEDPYPFDIHRQLVGQDLSEPGAGALPDAGDADVRDERTVGLGDDPSGLVRPVAALVVAARDTDPDRLAARAPLGPLGLEPLIACLREPGLEHPGAIAGGVP